MYKPICLFFGVTLLMSCDREPKTLPPVAVIDGRDKAPAQAAAAPAQPAPAPVQAAKAAPPTHPSVCEVEMSGEIKLPKGPRPKGVVKVFLADNDCMAKDAHMLGIVNAADAGHFFIEVFPRWGSDLTVCAAVYPEKGKPSRVYATLPRKFHAENLGEVSYPNTLIELAAGPPHLFPENMQPTEPVPPPAQPAR